jgi:hypothetical protein
VRVARIRGFTDDLGGAGGPINLGGDVSGSASATTVTGLQGTPVSSVAPAPGSYLRFTAGAWTPVRFAWMPLTTVVNGVPELVWDANDSLVPTEVPW